MGPGLLLLFSVLCSLLGLAATIETGPRRGMGPQSSISSGWVGTCGAASQSKEWDPLRGINK